MLLTASICPAAAHSSGQPRATPPQYATENYGLTFHVPPSTTYCPLPKGWVGSDHGTVIFLERPKRCGGTGYPSSSRGYEPADLATINIFYGYWLGEDETPAAPCQQIGTTMFLGARHPVCEERRGEQITRWVTARYQADGPAEATLTLTTRTARLQSDMATFQKTAATVRTCKTVWTAPKGRFTTGHGLPCPKGSRWF